MMSGHHEKMRKFDKNVHMDLIKTFRFIFGFAQVRILLLFLVMTLFVIAGLPNWPILWQPLSHFGHKDKIGLKSFTV